MYFEPAPYLNFTQRFNSRQCIGMACDHELDSKARPRPVFKPTLFPCPGPTLWRASKSFTPPTRSRRALQVCMYWCIYIYIYVCIDACICICIYVRTYVVGQSMAWHFKKITFNLSQSLGDRIKLTLLLLRSQGSVYQNQFCTQEPILRIYIQLHCQRCLKLQRQCCKNSQRQRSKILQRHE
jgi:hypothetical protein